MGSSGEIYIYIVVLFLALLGWKVRALTVSGAISAFFVGSIIYLGFSFEGLILLGAFFATSSLLSKYKRRQKGFLEDILEKGDRRDYLQVLANGGVPAIVSIIYTLTPDSLLLVVFCTSLAAANADTWASEVGTLSKGKPRMLLTLMKVSRGTSGAVSWLGTRAAIGGALFIAFVALVTFQLEFHHFLLILSFGFIGNLFDTILGSTLQVTYTCSQCGIKTERRIHCEKTGNQSSGLTLVNNDVVNFMAILLSSIFVFFILFVTG
ncbi:DUF92 domain-containing protein [Metabacillus herbersteinensis]|uniref:DUF92 domain-containing protein n=1 Tax=Metabacillus herbersteinensis TaxID=283816 RepID=A0ABV6G8X9_9BACI